MFDFEFYKQLVNFRSLSFSKEQNDLKNFLIQKYNKKNFVVNTDSYGNVYITKGNAENFVCIVAHLDINQNALKQNEKQILINKDNKIYSVNQYGNKIGTGHDDKIGIYFACKMLNEFSDLKVVFTLNEEVGCLGAKQINKKFFSDVMFIIQLDRRGASDFSQYTNGINVLTDEFMQNYELLLNKYNFRFADCVLTDVGELVKLTGVQGSNISCGYYNEHSNEEFLILDEYLNTEKFVKELIFDLYYNNQKWLINDDQMSFYNIDDWYYNDYSNLEMLFYELNTEIDSLIYSGDTKELKKAKQNIEELYFKLHYQ